MATRSIAAVLTAAVVGAGSRWALGLLAGGSCGLLVANVFGCILVGWASSSQQHKWDQAWLTVGLCGSLTSFAAVAVSLAVALEDQRWANAGLWGIATLVCCVVGFDLGRSLGDRK
ncbi:MAG: CrcB family protein [Acidimicrobiales bacterium]|jgi:fluoride ion exporter CrcB/FEX|nr:CrcB family protein [Acidimicrobiales bacterium]